MEKCELRQPERYGERVDKCIKGLLDGTVIEAASASTVCCFSFWTLSKKKAYGIKVDIRPCLDLRSLNARLKDIDFPLQKISEIIDLVGSRRGVHTWVEHSVHDTGH